MNQRLLTFFCIWRLMASLCPLFDRPVPKPPSPHGGLPLSDSRHSAPAQLSVADGRGMLVFDPASNPRGLKPCHTPSLCAWLSPY